MTKMKKTLLALSSALLLAAAGSASAQTYYYDYGYGNNPQYYSYDSDRDGIQDRYDRYDNRYDRYDDRYDRYDDRYDRYDNRYPSNAYYNGSSRYSTQRYADRDCDGVPNRYDRNDRYGANDRDCDGIPNRFDRIDDRTYRARMSYAAPSRYVTPYGYSYRTYSVGSSLPRGYYGNSYYVDYRPYGLSAPPYGYQWVRVGNDVYMVSTRTGLINEIVYSLFH
jgi:Ni/Co efflux regulator RcnB